MRKFGREKKQRKAFLKSLVGNLILRSKIKTTLYRAKEARAAAEKLISRIKKQKFPLAAYKIAQKALPANAAAKLVAEVAPKFKTRDGGYTRIIKIGRRRGDAADMAIIEFV